MQRLLQETEYRNLAWRLYERRNFGGLVSSLEENQAALKLLNARFGENHRFSITAIEDYRSCPYRFFLKYVLRVRPAPKPTMLPELLDLGNFII